MKKIVICFLAALMMVNTVRAEEDLSVYRFAVLEALISNHKALSNRLRDRVGIDGSVAFATNRTTSETQDYEDIVRKMQKRIEGTQAGVQFALELASLTSMAVKTVQLSSNAVDFALEKVDDNPLIVEAAAHVLRQSGKSIETIYKLIAMVAGGELGVVLGTNEDRTQFCFIIRTQMQRIQNLMGSLGSLAAGVSSIGFGVSSDAGKIKDVMNGKKDVDSYNEAQKRINQMMNRMSK